ncbi:uncharacterized protein LOC110044333 [Orbicella faveolata]|uniref:uncharacterized protein LOC110044333 n=1 Tax=Orbicella faveolata TaxID=48498 RepID=UPI0009E41A7F|nr:uncharacterized protein LOC110044333 [Orbicella faveolata]
MCNRQIISAACGITKHFSDRERVQIREEQELELKQSLASDKKKEQSMPGKSDDDTDEDYDVKTYRKDQSTPVKCHLNQDCDAKACRVCPRVSNKNIKNCISLEVYIMICRPSQVNWPTSQQNTEISHSRKEGTIKYR